MQPTADRDAAPPDPREIRIEGVRLWGAGLLLGITLFGAFWVGRVVGRRDAPRGPAAAGETGAAPAATIEPKEETISIFDRAGGPAAELEPQREAARLRSAAVPRSAPPAKPPTPAAAPSSGPWYVQVFAGRDRQAAELVARRHRDKGHPVRLDAEREGTGSLYKVRVGGFPDREAADGAAERLRGEGAKGAWVTRLPG